jgi:hypothetical protein
MIGELELKLLKFYQDYGIVKNLKINLVIKKF